MRAVIVTGSRRWSEHDAVDKALNLAWDESRDPKTNLPSLVVIHGCATGADAVASFWCRAKQSHLARSGVYELPMPADWARWGKSAGPRRNAEMLKALLALADCGYHASVEAFPLPNSIGTYDMIRKAQAAKVETNVYGTGEKTR